MINWFKNLKIFSKIIISFAVILLITLIIGFIGLNNLNKTNNINEEMYKKEFMTAKNVEKTISSLLYMDKYLEDKILSHDSKEKEFYNKKIQEHKIALLSSFKKASEMFRSQRNKELSVEFYANWSVFEQNFEFVNSIADSLDDKELEKAENLEESRVKPNSEVLEKILFQIEETKYKVSNDFYIQSQEIFEASRLNLLILLVLAIVVSLLIAILLAKTITSTVFNLKNSLEQVTTGNLDIHIDAPFKDELGDVINGFNSMISSLKDSKRFTDEQNWLKDGLNKLSIKLAGDNSLSTLTNKSISFLAEYLSAGSGVIYCLDHENQILKLLSSYAFSERNNLSNVYKIGEGIIGQTALEKKPILLKNIKRDDMTIVSGTVEQAPVNIIAFPLIYENELYGVIELAFFEQLTQLKQEFINQAAKTISTSIYSVAQSDKVKDLLVIAENSQKEAQQKAYEVQKANAELEEQQQQLQQQSEQMLQANAKLEEQQQQLQQQTEELRQSNSMLELQKQQVQEKEEETNKINSQLLITQSELDERANQLELSNKYKAEFLANMSHELRTPLNSIILLSQILSRNKRENLTGEDVEKVKVINNAGNELLRLINDILDLSKIESGKATLEIRDFYLNEVIDEQSQYFGSLASEKGLNFIINNEMKNQNLMIRSDSQKISQILRNFLSNAFKFTSEGDITITIKDSGNKEKPLSISVKDSGIGIPKDKQDLIFQAFSQVDGSTSRMYGGTGLGLSIAVELAKMLKGEIKLESEAGRGSSFILNIPYSIEGSEIVEYKEEKALNNTQNIVKNLVANEPKKESLPIKSQKIKCIEDDRNNISHGDRVVLIIEDDVDFANSVKYVNQDLNFKSIIATNGRDGLEYAFKYKPSGIILDMGLPDMNGVDVLNELKTTRELKHIPVHIISGNDKEEYDLQKKGALGFQQKPVSENDLNSILMNMVSFSEKKDKKVLIVEDNQQQLIAISELIKDHNIETYGVRTQKDAITEIDTGIYNLIIVDLGLKEGSGYAICDYIRQKSLNIPIIIYTGKQLTQDEEKELKKVSDTIVIKTVHSGERLIDEISMFLHVVSEKDNTNYISKVNNIKKDLELDGKTILIVDDDIKNTFVLTTALEQTNAEIVTAKNGREAIEVLEETPNIDLILMDIMMPVMNGYEAMEAIKADGKVKHIPIIAATAKALKDDKIKCFEAGADDYITKPIDFDVLLNIVEKWIDKKV